MDNKNNVWSRDEIESPCVKICVVDRSSRLCLGCFRSIDEIKDWSSMGADARRIIMGQLQDRKLAHKPVRKGGRRRTRS